MPRGDPRGWLIGAEEAPRVQQVTHNDRLLTSFWAGRALGKRFRHDLSKPINLGGSPGELRGAFCPWGTLGRPGRDRGAPSQSFFGETQMALQHHCFMFYNYTFWLFEELLGDLDVGKVTAMRGDEGP